MSTATKNGQTGLLALEAASAEITTASVTIRTLRVNSRQLTMGTFRQLQDRPMINEEKIELMGTVWGWVNYDSRPGHRHFIVQFGEKLCRHLQRTTDMAHDQEEHWPRPVRDLYWSYQRAFAAWVYAAALEGHLPLPDGKDRHDFDWTFAPWVIFGDAFGEYGEAIPFPYHDFTVSKFDERRIIQDAVHPRAHSENLVKDGRWVGTVERSECEVRKLAQAKLLDILGEQYPGGDRSCQGLKAAMERQIEEFDDYRTRWNALMGRLRGVEQLFIAT